MSELGALPKLSVCIITYNHAGFIRTCVESVLDQEVDFPVEIIIADDCSTDGTKEIVDALAAERPHRIRVLSRSANLGPTQNFLSLHNAATGEYVAHLDGDDLTLPGKLSRQVAFLEANPRLAVCGHRMGVITEDGVITGGQFPRNLPEQVSVGKVIRCGMPFLHSSMMYRRSSRSLKSANFEIFDWYILTDIMMSGGAGFIPLMLGLYRINSGSYIGTVRQSEMRARMLENVARRYQDMPRNRSDFFAFALLELSDSLLFGLERASVHWRLLRDSASLLGLFKAFDVWVWRRQNGRALSR